MTGKLDIQEELGASYEASRAFKRQILEALGVSPDDAARWNTHMVVEEIKRLKGMERVSPHRLIRTA